MFISLLCDCLTISSHKVQAKQVFEESVFVYVQKHGPEIRSFLEYTLIRNESRISTKQGSIQS